MDEARPRARKTGKRRRTREEIVEAVVAAATEAFAADESPTVRAIARRAGVQPSVIFRYFGSKQGLLGEVIARGARRDAEIIAEFFGRPPELVAATLSTNPAYRAALLHAIMGGLRPDDVPGGLASIDLTVDGLSSGGFTPIQPDARYDPRLVAAFLAAAMLGWQLSGDFFAAAAGLGRSDRDAVQSAVAYILYQIYGLADPQERLDES